MDCYEEMYYRLFNKITDVIEELKEVQQAAEEMLISQQTGEKGNVLSIQRKDEGPKETDGK